MSRFIDTTKTCSCDGWKTDAIEMQNVEAVASNGGKRYEGKPATHCPWCGKELRKLVSTEG